VLDWGAETFALNVLDRLRGVARWISTRVRRAPESRWIPGRRPPHDGFEVLPLHFEVNLDLQVPTVTVAMYAVNYTRHELEVASLAIDELRTAGVPFASIGLLGEPIVRRRSAFVIYARRRLADSEAREASRSGSGQWSIGSINFVARARHGHTQLKYGPVAAMTISGVVNGRFAVPGPA